MRAPSRLFILPQKPPSPPTNSKICAASRAAARIMNLGVFAFNGVQLGQSGFSGEGRLAVRWGTRTGADNTSPNHEHENVFVRPIQGQRPSQGKRLSRFVDTDWMQRNCRRQASESSNLQICSCGRVESQLPVRSDNAKLSRRQRPLCPGPMQISRIQGARPPIRETRRGAARLEETNLIMRVMNEPETTTQRVPTCTSQGRLPKQAAATTIQHLPLLHWTLL
ncbi:hypothetical protein B0H63DRAFT_26647 [Podospora didyma]|uniref:Uncharacterized protein n=1 Tax=Podospora didyma TaxID=330526 RepID=A0AAE0P5F7_9PEZI|nr:hypothetical protein B0H63DRAFT_26647 [Podospora didyma]